MDYLEAEGSKCRQIRHSVWERNGLIFAVGPRTCSGPSGSLGAPKKGAQDPAAKWAVIWTPAESLLFPSALLEPYSEAFLLPFVVA